MHIFGSETHDLPFLKQSDFDIYDPKLEVLLKKTYFSLGQLDGLIQYRDSRKNKIFYNSVFVKLLS
jgi:hypothetical protein